MHIPDPGSEFFYPGYGSASKKYMFIPDPGFELFSSRIRIGLKKAPDHGSATLIKIRVKDPDIKLFKQGNLSLFGSDPDQVYFNCLIGIWSHLNRSLNSTQN
jgi:hypothetical protein